jgi:hypothetical protein
MNRKIVGTEKEREMTRIVQDTWVLDIKDVQFWLVLAIYPFRRFDLAFRC